MFISCRCCGFNRNWIHGVKNPQSPTIFGSKSEIIWATSFLGHGPWTVGTFFPYDGYLGTLPRESSRAMISLLVTSPLHRWPLQCFSTCWSCCHQILVVTCGSPQESKIGGDHPSGMRIEQPSFPTEFGLPSSWGEPPEWIPRYIITCGSFA